MNIKTIDTLVISGGGFKGISYCGVFKKLRELETLESDSKGLETKESESNGLETKETKIKIQLKKICSVSIGTFFGLLYLLNYEYDEIEEELLNKNFDTLKDPKLINFINEYGLDSGENIITWLETLIIKKGYAKDITFLELYNKTNICFQVVATNLNRYKLTIFDNINTPNYSIIDAIRLSISLPFIFTKREYNGDIHVDGGIINNYPIDLFKDNLESVLGIKLIGGRCDIERYDIDKLDSYIYNVMSCFIKQRDNNILQSDIYSKSTIFIYTNDITSTIKFDMSRKDKKRLIKIGYKAADDYFNELIKSKK